MTTHDTFFALTTLDLKENENQRTVGERNRTVGIFSHLGEAKNILQKNIGDLNEGGWYPYAVIEEFPFNFLYPQLSVVKDKLARHWYKFDHELNTWRVIDEPATNHILPFATIG